MNNSNIKTAQKMTLAELKQRLSYYLAGPVDIVLKNNRSTYLHVVSEKKKTLKLMLHKAFLFASESICEALAVYILKDDSKAKAKVRKFAYEQMAIADYSSALEKQHLYTQGTYYDLQEIYDRINDRYFDNKLSCKITWFARPKYKTWSHLTLGSYHDTMNLIRINQLLDDPYVPPYVLSFIVYHEMIHAVIPTTINHKGRKQCHTKAFKNLEKKYYYYTQAMRWEKEYLDAFLRRKQRILTHGRP